MGRVEAQGDEGHRQKVFITGRSIAKEALALLEEESWAYIFGDEGDDPSTIVQKVRESQPDGLVVRKGRITRDVLKASQRLRAVSKHGVGVDNIDVSAATEMGIPVMITAWANYESVAEYTLGLMLTLLRSIHRQHEYTRKGGWDKAGYQGEDLLGKRLGMVGCGRIGKRLCELVAPFRTKVLVYDPYLPQDQVPPNAQQVSDLKVMLSMVDILSIHCPLSPETRGMIAEDELAELKPGAYLINTARGSILDEAALFEALHDGRIKGAALDTFQQEPPDPNNPLFAMENVIVTNHVAGSSADALANMGIEAVRNVMAVLKGNRPEPSCIVNPEVLENRPC